MASYVDHKQQRLVPNVFGGATAAPPPTPSTQTNHFSTSAAADALSTLLHRLPPNLSLPTRRSPSLRSSPTTTISFSDDANPSLLNNLLSSSSELGFFQLTDHPVASELARSAESESLALFELPMEKKESLFPKNWPLGFRDGDEEADGSGESFCLDSSCSSELSLPSLQEFVSAMEKLGLKIVEFLSQAVGFENPVGEDPTRFRTLVWISEGSGSSEPATAGGFYPYIVGLHYQTKNQKYSLLGDPGWTSAAPPVDSVMVSIGDIAQVWSNGKLKKVRGRPVPMVCSTNNDGNNDNSQRRILISLLITLPFDSEVSPLLPMTVKDCKDDVDTKQAEEKEEDRIFHSFCFEEYAWKVYHDRCFLFKDPLDKYRIRNFL